MCELIWLESERCRIDSSVLFEFELVCSLAVIFRLCTLLLILLLVLLGRVVARLPFG